jgi:hypothetical protein
MNVKRFYFEAVGMSSNIFFFNIEELKIVNNSTGISYDIPCYSGLTKTPAYHKTHLSL